ncbi:MurR/RpiR family transcriptional regulator [Thalassotalea marina]|uniref:Transcriptional regulator n=1 Tax=Thalassotalea marina TaxID=1673741 RepID=A0A919BH65_9GAMM|nr:MurR/RpiR family transcriptional regulator [Thalassotalea marina]GHF87668.1 transcriptional regulator [Thalassotalea marina]
MDILARIEQRLPHMRPAEQQVAQFIQQDVDLASRLSIQDLAQQAMVSNATITRLAKTLDCQNVRDLKLQLAQSAAVGERFNQDAQTETQHIPEVYQSIHQILQLNAGLISTEVAQAAAQLISGAAHCLVFGVGGGSTVFAQECQHRFFRLSVRSNAYSDPMLMRMTAANVDEQDVILCLSLSGISPDVLTSANIAQEYGAKVIAICPDGDLARSADIHLPICTDESDYIFKPSASRYAMLAAIDILASELAVLNQRKSREKLRRLKLHLDEHRQSNGRMPLGD